MRSVFVVDTKRQPLNPVHPGRARLLLKEGKAAVLRRFPFTIMLKRAVEQPTLAPFRLKIDPGSRTTGLALLNDATGEVVWAAELSHRGQAIKAALQTRRAVRRARRSRKTRYRKPRFANRRRRPGWLPPSVESRVANILTWLARLRWRCPIEAISLELVTFDTQALQQPEITGIEYQQGELFGYEVRNYLLEKWGRACAYCGQQGVRLQVEHIQARSNGGSNRVSNLTLACEDCNQRKGKLDVRVFLANKPEVLVRLLTHAKAPLRDAAAVNSSRWALNARLKMTGLPVEVGSGGLTKYNRTIRHLPKTHWLDAACVGLSTPEILVTSEVIPLMIKATGHGSRQMCGTNASGFPIRHRSRQKVHHGYQTGDLARAVVPVGKKAGTYVGRVLARASGSFDLVTAAGRITGISARYCQPLHHNDGYGYAKGARHEQAT